MWPRWVSGERRFAQSACASVRRARRGRLVIDALARGLAQQVLDHPLALVVLALAEVVVADPALRVCESQMAGQYRLAKAVHTP